MCQPEIPTINSATAFAAASTNSSEKPSSGRTVSWHELAKHKSTNDAWIAIKGRVYDVTDFAKYHPGGDIIFTAAGMDATDVFAAFHASTSAALMLPPLCVGQLDEPTSPLVKNVDIEYACDIQKMRNEVRSLRLFDSSKLYYAFKILSNVAICATSASLALAGPTSSIVVFIAGILMALFWQQCGWLAHDFLHHQVFKYRPVNNVFGVLVGNIFQGFSVSWWKDKHNHHHAVPNVTDAPSGGDPDIATMPILFWSEKLIEQEKLEDLPRWMLRNQAILYWPVLCVARTSWLLQSILYQLQPRNPNVTSTPLYIAELAGLAVHHGLYAALVVKIGLSSIWSAVLFHLVCQATGGLFLGLVFTVGHNAMDVLTEEEMRKLDFVRLQVRTTRNVNPHWFTDWFCGGLNYQVEHHIFPSIPRHHLPAVAKMFRQFCYEHSIPYTSETLIAGNKSVCAILKSISKSA